MLFLGWRYRQFNIDAAESDALLRARRAIALFGCA